MRGRSPVRMQSVPLPMPVTKTGRSVSCRATSSLATRTAEAPSVIRQQSSRKEGVAAMPEGAMSCTPRNPRVVGVA